MARYDKYDPKAGGYRAPLAADLAVPTAAAGNGNPVGVGLDAFGRTVVGAGQTGITAVLVTTRVMRAGDIVDNMTDGEIVEMADVPAGTVLTADNVTGVIDATAPGAGRTRVGHTVEAQRLIVRVGRV